MVPRDLPGVSAYAILLALSLTAGTWMTWRRWRAGGGSPRPILLAMALGVAMLFAGAKALYLAQFGWSWRWQDWASDGMSLYGGLIGLLAGWLLARVIAPFPLVRLLDAATPALALGLFLTRIGCFLHGCNAGVPADLPWAVCYPAGSLSHAQQVRAGLIDRSRSKSLPVHPTQLYESLFGMACFVALRRASRVSTPPGTVFAAGIGSYAIVRFALETIRADHNGATVFGVLTFAQAVSAGVLLFALFLLVRASLSAGTAT